MIPRSLVPILMLTFSPILQAQGDWEETRSIAQSQHEIILLLIEKKEFDEVPPAAEEIFKLHFPPEHEDKLVEEIRILTDALLHHNQTSIAHQLLDKGLAKVTVNRSKAELHREKAYLFKREGKADEAMNAFKLAKEIEQRTDP